MLRLGALRRLLAQAGGPAVHEFIANADALDEPRLTQALLERGLLDEEKIAQAKATLAQLPYIDVRELTVSPNLFALVPPAFAHKHVLLPLERHGDALDIAMADPFDLDALDAVERLTRLAPTIKVASRAAIVAALRRSDGAGEMLKGISEQFRIGLVQEGQNGEERVVALEADQSESSPVIRLVNTLLLNAIEKRASDVHIEAYAKGVIVKYRIDGVLYPATAVLDASHHAAVVSRLKVMSELDIAEKRIPQDGRFKLRINGRDIDFRVSILPSAFGEDVVIRILDKSSVTAGFKDLRLEALGMAPDAMRALRRAIREPYGMVLITGPTGSGKTTTLYAALGEFDVTEEKIITIEDPVEYQLDGVVQVPVNEKKNLTFARGLRSILRHDPDKIMVGEIRDSETAQIAVQAALTGHLVFSTVHANNAFDVIGRLAHMGIDLYNFVSALNCVVAQRLVRLLCPRCKRAGQVTDELAELSGLTAADRTHTFFEAVGCEQCNGTGYRGRAAITEFLALTPDMRRLIIERRPVAELEQRARSDGMQSLRQSAMDKARAGETTLKEINRVTFVD